MNYKYKPRCSSLGNLFSGCGKAKNKLEWEDLKNMNDTHIKLAIDIFNFVEYGYEKKSITTLDMNAGTEHEPKAVALYDECFGTNYEAGYLFRKRKTNDLITGERDIGDYKKTTDIKISTDKEVFDLKKFKPVEVDHALQLNGYGVLYGTKELELCNVLMPKTFGQIAKMVSSDRYVKMLSDEQADALQEKYEEMYSCKEMPLEKRFMRIGVPIIKDFESILEERVRILNEWIERNKHML